MSSTAKYVIRTLRNCMVCCGQVRLLTRDFEVEIICESGYWNASIVLIDGQRKPSEQLCSSMGVKSRCAWTRVPKAHFKSHEGVQHWQRNAPTLNTISLPPVTLIARKFMFTYIATVVCITQEVLPFSLNHGSNLVEIISAFLVFSF